MSDPTEFEGEYSTMRSQRGQQVATYTDGTIARFRDDGLYVDVTLPDGTEVVWTHEQLGEHIGRSMGGRAYWPLEEGPAVFAASTDGGAEWRDITDLVAGPVTIQRGRSGSAPDDAALDFTKPIHGEIDLQITDPAAVARMFDVPPWTIGAPRPRFARLRWALRRWWPIKPAPAPLGHDQNRD